MMIEGGLATAAALFCAEGEGALRWMVVAPGVSAVVDALSGWSIAMRI